MLWNLREFIADLRRERHTKVEVAQKIIIFCYFICPPPPTAFSSHPFQ